MTIKTFYHQHQEKIKEVISYLFFGVASMLVNFAVYFFFSNTLHWNYMLANLLSWIAAVLFAFFTNKFFVFKSQTRHLSDFLKELFSFIGFRVISFGLDAGILYFMVAILVTGEFWAKVVSQFAVVVANYVFSKLFIFKKNSL